VSQERLAYRFGPLERRGLLGSVRLGQAVLIGGSLAAGVGLLDQFGGMAGVLAAAAVLGASCLMATAPVAGRTVDQWTPIVGAFMLRGTLNGRRFRSRMPMSGVGPAADPGPELPHPLRDVSMVTIELANRRLGALSERRGRLLTTVLACRSLSFALLDPEVQERRLAQWGSVLASAASTPIRRLQWIERTAPAQGDELARWLSSARDPSLPARGTPIVESYLELLARSTQVRHDHEILLAAQIDTDRLGERRERTSQRVAEEVGRLARSLEAADIKVLGVLSASQIARVLLTAFDPFARSELTLRDATAGRRDTPPTRNATPLATEETWDHYRCDGACHATFWISGWPATGVTPMFMDSLLGTSAAIRTVAVTFEPVDPERSAREVEAAITRDRADSELRRRFGQSETARQRQSQEAAARREAELAAGHGEVRLAGFVTVSGRDEDELRRACAEVHTHAARGRLELRRMYGQQAETFTFTLPLARGLR
jgi:hypothetical protein